MLEPHDHLFAVLIFPEELNHFQYNLFHTLFLSEGNQLDFDWFILRYFSIYCGYHIWNLSKLVVHLEDVAVLNLCDFLDEIWLGNLHFSKQIRDLLIGIANKRLDLLLREGERCDL